MVDDGMIVKVHASGTDKIRAQNNAQNNAKMQMTDPYYFFKDMGYSNAEERTEYLILAKADPVAYLQKVVKNLDTSQALAQALMNSNIPTNEGMPVQPTQPQPQPPQNPVLGGPMPQPQVPLPTGQPNTAVPAQPAPNPAAPPPGSVR